MVIREPNTRGIRSLHCDCLLHHIDTDAATATHTSSAHKYTFALLYLGANDMNEALLRNQHTITLINLKTATSNGELQATGNQIG